MKFRFEDLRLSDEILDYIDEVYRITAAFPKDERFGLTSQVRRSATSVYLNIAEGSSRRSKPDFARFITIASSSLIESYAGFKIALRRGYVSDSDFVKLQLRAHVLWRKLCALHRSQLSS